MMKRTSSGTNSCSAAAIALALAGTLAFSQPAAAQAMSDVEGASGEEPVSVAPEAPMQEPPAEDAASVADDTAYANEGGETDILSRNTISLMFDARFVVANGERSFVDGGFGKTRFQGTRDRGYKARLVPAEVDLVWTPRFTGSLTANVSVAYQNDHESDVDLIEAFVSYLPQSDAKFSVSARAGLMWPEISLEHSTGGAWSTVNTITPSAINSWVGEETKVLGVEATLHASLGQHQVLATVGVFGFNDTSGTLLSFRGWALHDQKAMAFSHFPLPPLNDFMVHAQENRTRSTIDLDKKPGYYFRLDWRPPSPFGVALFYYDNKGDPEAVFDTLQWGWRTRFWNLGMFADIGPSTHVVAQGMAGSTIMGFKVDGVPWVHTYFRSAFVSVTQDLGPGTALTGRIEAFGTREHGSRMDPAQNDEDGWASAIALRHAITPNLTGFVEALNVRSRRGMRAVDGLAPFQAQTVFQASLRFKL